MRKHMEKWWGTSYAPWLVMGLLLIVLYFIIINTALPYIIVSGEL